MDMMLVLGILAAIFLVSFTLICLYRETLNIRVFNTLFVVVDVLFYFVWNVGMYEQGWLDDGFETLANISPMIFTVIPLTCFMNETIRLFRHCFFVGGNVFGAVHQPRASLSFVLPYGGVDGIYRGGALPYVGIAVWRLPYFNKAGKIKFPELVAFDCVHVCGNRFWRVGQLLFPQE